MRIWIGACALLWAVSANAAPATEADVPLTLGQALALVLENNPQLQAADFDTRAVAARIRQQSLGTPWQVGMQLENLAGSVAEQQAILLRHEQDAERLDLLAEAAQRFVVIAQAQARGALAQEQLDTARKTQRAVQRRLRAGKATKAEINRAKIGVARAELLLEETNHLLLTSRTRLGVLWGEFSPTFKQVSNNLLVLSEIPDYAALERLIDNNPALALLATQERLADARLQLARAQRQPDLDLSVGIRRFSASDDTGLMFSLSMPLGSRGRTVGYEDEARALAQREPLLAQDRKLALRATLFSLHQELLYERGRLQMLRTRIIPAATRTVDDTGRGYSTGRYSLLELTQAQDALLQAHLEVLDAAVSYQHTRIQIERLTGAALRTGVNPGVKS